MQTNTLRAAVLAATSLGVAAVSNGCSTPDSYCCRQYNPGTDMSLVMFTHDPTVNRRFVATAQAAGDLAVVAGQARADVTSACKAIAVDLGEDPTSGAGMTGPDLMTFWCGKAKMQLFASGLSVKVVSQPVRCATSVSVQTDCKARCDVNGSCDHMANPPTCTGGTLVIDCHGGCASGAPSYKIECAGSCAATCEGTCGAVAGVTCNGRCDGSCSVAPAMDGTCAGTCDGTCHMEAGGSCSGTCIGTCSGRCSPSAGSTSVECSGKCDSTYQLIECRGGTLQGGCKVDASCETSCDASAEASARCPPPDIALQIQGTSANRPLVQATLEANLKPIAVVLQGRAKPFADVIHATGNVMGNIAASGNLDRYGSACAGYIADNVAETGATFEATLDAATTIGTVVGM